jgi:hypothetical protein
MTSIDAERSIRKATTEAAERMAQAAANLLAALEPEQRRKASLDFSDTQEGPLYTEAQPRVMAHADQGPGDTAKPTDERRRWFYTPTDHGGVPLRELTPLQQTKALQLVASGLSVPGFNVATAIIGLELALEREEGWRTNFFRDRGRDPGLYYVSVFGEPGGKAPWGWRFGGHHISLHYTVVNGAIVAPTPTFFGSHPAELPLVGPGVLRPLAGEEDLARELLHLLDEEQRTQAVISSAAPWDLVTGNRSALREGDEPPYGWEIFREEFGAGDREERLRRHERAVQRLGLTPENVAALRYSKAPKGLPAKSMNAAQRQALLALVEQYLGRMPDEIAAVERERLAGPALDGIHFAWAGGSERRQPHYYRLQGPRFLVEYDNTQDNVNHIHSVWRDPEGDWGADLLTQHYAAAH